MRAQGWCPDPYGKHDERWFSDGKPTSLVRDHGTESHDEPPQGQPTLNPLRDEPQRERLPAYRVGPVSDQEWLARPVSGKSRWWTVCLPGLLALVVSVFGWFVVGLASALSCFDTCQTPDRRGVSLDAVAIGEGIVFTAAVVLLVGGLVVPAWRRVIAAVLWVATALAIGFVAVPWA